jgi:putative ABC transport system permease protein
MTKKDLFTMAYRNLMQRKGRTILTVLGVVIGTAAIVVMLSLGIGLNESQRQNMERWGNLNVIRVQSGMSYDMEGNPIGEAKTLDDDAVAELKALEGVAAVSPAIDIGGEAKWGRKQGHLQIIGLDPEQLEALEFAVSDGRLLEEYDRNSIIVGSEVINNFWDEREMQQRGNIRGPMERPQNDPTEMLDQRVTLTMRSMADHNRTRIYNFQVVGILDESNMERAWEAYAPIEEVRRIRDFVNQGARSMTEVRAMPGVVESKAPSPRQADRSENIYSYILVRAQDVNYAKQLSTTIREDLGYNAWSMADNLEGIEQMARVMQAILGGIGGISLLVAALGITNTMIMSIYERTKEIGIMKVVGASFQDIRLLFLTEAGLIGIGGGSIGLLLSYLISYGLNHFGAGYINMGMVGGEQTAISLIPPWLALFAVGFALLVGLLAGFYPANRAMRLSPVVAIRND